MRIQNRIGAILLLALYFSFSYKGVQYLVSLAQDHHILTLPGEADIPFIPETFVIYASMYLVFPLLFLLVPRDGHVAKVLLAFFLTSLIHYTIYLLLPVRYILRPNLTHATDILHQMIAALYVLDGPFNNFPSLHVSYAFLCFFAARRYLPHLGTPLFILAVAIAASTVLVKQHYILDVISAIPVALLVNYLIFERLKIRNGKAEWRPTGETTSPT